MSDGAARADRSRRSVLPGSVGDRNAEAIAGESGGVVKTL